MKADVGEISRSKNEFSVLDITTDLQKANEYVAPAVQDLGAWNAVTLQVSIPGGLSRGVWSDNPRY